MDIDSTCLRRGLDKFQLDEGGVMTFRKCLLEHEKYFVTVLFHTYDELEGRRYGTDTAKRAFVYAETSSWRASCYCNYSEAACCEVIPARRRRKDYTYHQKVM
jgi:hypothetical protein